MIEAIQKPGTTEIIYAGNTLSANALNRMLAQLEGKDFYIDCIAKNFETLEPGIGFRASVTAPFSCYAKDMVTR